MKTSEITKRWNVTGLLDGLTGINKTRCSIILNDMSDLLLGKYSEIHKKVDKKLKSEGFLAVTMFPIIRRLYNLIPDKMPTIDAKKLLEDYVGYISKNKIVSEEECCKDYSIDVANRIKNNLW
jgi:hypothetical protein